MRHRLRHQHDDIERLIGNRNVGLWEATATIWMTCEVMKILLLECKRWINKSPVEIDFLEMYVYYKHATIFLLFYSLLDFLVNWN